MCVRRLKSTSSCRRHFSCSIIWLTWAIIRTEALENVMHGLHEIMGHKSYGSVAVELNTWRMELCESIWCRRSSLEINSDDTLPKETDRFFATKKLTFDDFLKIDNTNKWTGIKTHTSTYNPLMLPHVSIFFILSTGSLKSNKTQEFSDLLKFWSLILWMS